MSTTVPPIQAVGQDYNRKKKKPLPQMRPARQPYSATEDVEGLFGGGVVEAAKGLGRQAMETGRHVLGEAVESFAGGGVDRPAPTGAGKAAQGAAEQKAASGAATTQAPAAQPDEKTPATPTSTGGGGPAVDAGAGAGAPSDVKGPQPPSDLGPGDRVVRLPGEGQGYAIVHAGPDGQGPPAPDPATQKGGFAHAGAMKADPTGRLAEEKRIAALPEAGTTEYGPAGATGGHSWTRRTPGRQEAAYDASRYRREVQARQASEDAAISALDAQAAQAAADISRSEALEEQPFAPEMAAAAGRVGAQRAKAQPEMQLQALAGDLFQSYQENKARIMAQEGLTEEQRRAAIQDARDEFYMALAGMRGYQRRDDLSSMMLGPEEEEA